MIQKDLSPYQKDYAEGGLGFSLSEERDGEGGGRPGDDFGRLRPVSSARVFRCRIALEQRI